jgi:isocitrate dehydrogenase (NAD+)
MNPHTTTTIPATLIQGDGIGPEIMDATLTVLDALGAPFAWEVHKAGMDATEDCGDPLPESTLESIRRTRLVLKGPITQVAGTCVGSVNERLRAEFKLFANVRHVRNLLPGGRSEDLDLIMVRENTEGLYVGYEHYVPIDDDPAAVAEAVAIITRSGCRRIAQFTFDYALKYGRKKVTIVHKANILKKLTGLFLETALEVGRRYQERLQLEDQIVDDCAMQLVINPGRFDVILTTNMFGNILSDEIAGLVGGRRLVSSGHIGANTAVFEAAHGSAPKIAGQGIANPLAQMLAAAMMLEHVGRPEPARRLRNALDQVLREDGIKTRDLGGTASTAQFTEAVIRRIRESA